MRLPPVWDRERAVAAAVSGWMWNPAESRDAGSLKVRGNEAESKPRLRFPSSRAGTRP